MGWKHINGRPYYYRSVREAGRVRSEYVGRGEVASLIARMEALDREQREIEREDWKAEREQAEREDRELAAWFDRGERLADAALYAAGYHKHKGQWRRRRRHVQDERSDGGPAPGHPDLG